MRKSNIDINDSLKWEEPKQEMFKSAIRLIHKIIKMEKPREIITRPEVSEADPQRNKSNQKVTEKCLICQVSQINP